MSDSVSRWTPAGNRTVNTGRGMPRLSNRLFEFLSQHCGTKTGTIARDRNISRNRAIIQRGHTIVPLIKDPSLISYCRRVPTADDDAQRSRRAVFDRSQFPWGKQYERMERNATPYVLIDWYLLPVAGS